MKKEKENILISACLLGSQCTYKADSNYLPIIEELKKDYNLIPVCPEVLGGLTVPRAPSEIQGDKVINNLGVDVTSQFNFGAQKALDVAIKNNCLCAILKERSPSCGTTKIYDGSFQKILIDGMGLTSKKLLDANIKPYNEEIIEELIRRKK